MASGAPRSAHGSRLRTASRSCAPGKPHETCIERKPRCWNVSSLRRRVGSSSAPPSAKSNTGRGERRRAATSNRRMPGYFSARESAGIGRLDTIAVSLRLDTPMIEEAHVSSTDRCSGPPQRWSKPRAAHPPDSLSTHCAAAVRSAWRTRQKVRRGHHAAPGLLTAPDAGTSKLRSLTRRLGMSCTDCRLVSRTIQSWPRR